MEIKEETIVVENVEPVVASEPEVAIELVVEEVRSVGRPSDFTQEKADEICSLLSEGISLRTVCLADDMPNASTVFRWLRTNADFCNQYARAKEESTDAKLEDMEIIGEQAINAAYEADPKAANAVVSAYKLKADSIKWTMSKLKPKKYGDRIDHTNDGKAFPTPIMQLNIQSNNNAKELGE